MRYLIGRALHLAAGVVAMTLLVVSPAAAQNRGQYILGTTGLNSGVQPRPGLSYTNIFTFNTGGQLVDAGGEALAGLRTPGLAVDQNIFAYTTGFKIFGGNYGVKLDVPLADGAIAMSRPGARSVAPAVSDIYVEPFNIGWHLLTADLRVAYGFFAPTGANRLTSDYWGHDITAAATVYLNEKKTTSFSLNAILELHQKKRHQDVRVGNSLNVEYGVGSVVPVGKEAKTFLRLGVVGYLQWQLARDSGPNIPVRTDNPRDQVFAVGPEAGVTISPWKANLLFRYGKEVYVRNRGRGQTFAVSFSKYF